MSTPEVQKIFDPVGWFALVPPEQAIAKLDPAAAHSIFVGNWLFDSDIDLARNDPRWVNFLATLGLTEAHARAQAWRKAHPAVKP